MPSALPDYASMMFPITSAAQSGAGAGTATSPWLMNWSPNVAPAPVDTNALTVMPSFNTTAASTAAPMSGWDSFKNWWDTSGILGKTNPDSSKVQGWGGLALGAASGLMNSYMGLQQYNLAKQSLAENRRQFDLNYNAQQKTVNSQLEDRQAARVASNPTAYQSVGDYMKKYGI